METIVSCDEQKVCGSCGRKVGYLEFNGSILVVAGEVAIAGDVLVVERHRCLATAGGGDQAERQRGGLPVWVLDRILQALERVHPQELSTTEVAARVFDGAVSVEDVRLALDELLAVGEVTQRWPVVKGQDATWVRVEKDWPEKVGP